MQQIYQRLLRQHLQVIVNAQKAALAAIVPEKRVSAIVKNKDRTTHNFYPKRTERSVTCLRDFL